MFHQVKIKESDQHSQRFLWREDKSLEPDVYVMQVMTFGASCSPCSAQYVKNKNALEYEEQYPRASLAITKNHYVDDLLDSVDTEEAAIQLIRDVVYVHSKGGFEIQNWLSNSKTVLNSLPESSKAVAKNLDINPEISSEKILGMWWCHGIDMFTYSLKYNKISKEVLSGSRKPTKREVLRTLMSIYDPLGLLSFYLVYVKILLQEIWRSSIGSDDSITNAQFQKWLNWIQLLPKTEEIQIPRWYFTESFSNMDSNIIELYIIVDASENAYAAVAYFRVVNQNGVSCTLIGGKSKVAPLQALSIPRLELQAALLGARFANDIRTGHSLKIDKQVFWSDSRTVLSWLKSDQRNYRQYVAFRIGEILELTNVNEWRWVPTKENVADEATKWEHIPKISSYNRWFTGPSFLLESDSHWPEDTTTCNTEVEELKINLVHQLAVSKIINYQRSSNWFRLLRTQAFIFRFIFNVRAKRNKTSGNYGPFSQEEIIMAENQLFKYAQRECYKDEVIILQNNKNLPTNEQLKIEKSSPIYTFSPYLDDNGILRIHGRIDAAKNIDINIKRPIILPKQHEITNLIVMKYHRRFHHHNTETVINEIRQKFHISTIRVVLRKITRNCQQCKNDKVVPIVPEMAELPKARLAIYERPFSYVGIDYFGPMTVCIGRRTEKRWGVIFTCLTIRAVHIELANSLSTDSCIMCIRNFICRRGTPNEIYCDNGTNFRGADNELKKELLNVNFENIQEKFTKTTMKWFFNPPVSPHMGGSWERLVLSIKKTLKIIMPTRNPTEPLLNNLLMEVEHIVNSRPLTYVPLSSDDDEALTPNHFLLGSSNGSKPAGEFGDDVLLLRKKWKMAQNLANSFWKRWICEYLPTLTKRTKWFTKSDPIKPGDIVIIVDDKNERNIWPKGKIVKVITAKDGQVRRAVVQTSTGIYERPTARLAVLDIYNE